MDILATFPKQIAVNSTAGAQIYRLIADHYAIHGRQSGEPAPDAAYVLQEGTIAVFKGSPDPALAAAKPERLSAVYSLTPGGSPAVPTGLVFIRLAEGTAIAERDEAIKNTGYEVSETLPYAANAAWLRSRSGGIADALASLGALEKIPSVESVEPQMLMESARR